MMTSNVDKQDEEIKITTNNNTQITGEPSSDNNSPKISLRDIIVAELQALVTRSKDLQKKINEAKTKPKKDLYLKKIRKNNEQVAEMLLALQKLDYKERVLNETKQQPTE